MSLAFVPHYQRAKGPPNQATIQKMLDENNQLIQAIIDYQNKGDPNEVNQYQHLLHRNLVYLATIADSNQNNQALLPALGSGQGNQNQMGGPMSNHGNQMPPGQMPPGQMPRPGGQMPGQMMGPRPNVPGQPNQTQPGQNSGQGVTAMALSKLMQLRPQVAMGDRNTPSPGGQNPAQRPPMPSAAPNNGSNMPMSSGQPMGGQPHYPHGQSGPMMMPPGQMMSNQNNTPTSGTNIGSSNQPPSSQQTPQAMPQSQTQQAPQQTPMSQNQQMPPQQAMPQHQGMPSQQQPMMTPTGVNPGQPTNPQMMGQRGQMPPPPHPPGPPFRRSPNQGSQFGPQGAPQPQPSGMQQPGNYPPGSSQYGNQGFGGQNPGQPGPGGPPQQGFNGPPGNMPPQGNPGQYNNHGNYGPGQQGANQPSQVPNQMGYNPYGQRGPMPGGPNPQMRPPAGQTGSNQMPSQMHPPQGGMTNQVSGGQPSGQPGYGNYNQNQY